MAKVFISYSSKNRDLVKALAADIDELGHLVWFDKELTGGHAWWDSILQAVRTCEVFIFALSPESLDSEPCSREYKYAHALNKMILPVLITGTVSANLLPRELSLLQYVDYRQADKAATLRLGRAFMALPAPKPLPEPLPEAPAVPIAPILGLREQIESPSLSFEQQTTLLFQLKQELKSPATRADAMVLLQRLRKRHDVIAAVQDQIDEALDGSGAIRNKGIAQTPKPLREAASASSNAASNDGIHRRIIIFSTLVWSISLSIGVTINNVYHTDVTLFLSFFALSWILQGLYTAFQLYRHQKKSLLWYARSALAGGLLLFWQAQYSSFKLSLIFVYLAWLALNLGVIAAMLFLVLNPFFHWIWDSGFADLYFTSTMAFLLWGVIIGFSLSFSFSIINNLARRQVAD